MVFGRLNVSLNGYFLRHPMTGSGQYAVNLGRALKRLAPDDRFDLAPIGAFHKSLGRPGKLMWELSGWPRAARRSQAQIVHSPYLSATSRKDRHVMTVHDLIGFVLRPYARTPWMRIYNALAKSAARNAALLLADSEHTARDITRIFGVSRDRVRVVPLGVDPGLAPAPPEAVEQLRSRYELLDSFVLYLGGGDTRKSLDTLMRSWFLTPPGKRPLLALAGRIPNTGSALFPDYRKVAAGFGIGDSVRFLGPVDESAKAALMSAAAAFVFPSTYEGFGLEPLEAMACGTPVICSDRTSLPEVVGDAAFLADPDEPHEWVEAVSSLLGDPRKSRDLVEAGRARAAEFTWKKTARLTLSAYSELL